MRALGILGARRQGRALVLCLVGAYLWLSFSGEDPMSRWLNFVFHDALGMALWLGLAMNLVLRAVELIIDRLHAAPPAIEEMDNVAEVSGGEGFGDWLREHFGLEQADRSPSKRHGRLSVLPGALLRVGFAVVMVALLASAHVRVEETRRFAVHQEKRLLGTAVTLTDLESGMPENYLAAGDDNMFSLKHPNALLAVEGRSFSLNEGYAAKAAGTYYRMTDIGIYQPITAGGSPREVGGHLDVLPPGRRANIFLPDFDATLTLKLAPASTMQKGLITGKVYDLVSPSYEVSVKRGTADSEVVTMGEGQKAVITGVPIALGKTGMSVEVQAVHNPALWWFYAGLWLMLAGLVLTPLRFIWYVKEVRVELSEGTARIGYSEEYFKKWAGVRFETWVQERQDS